MDAGGHRSVVLFGTESFTSKYDNQVHRTSRAKFPLQRLPLPFLISICLFSSLTVAQTLENVPQPQPTVSVAELRSSGKEGEHLKNAHKEFTSGNLIKAQRELERALEIDPLCALAFSMKAFLDLAARKPHAAIEDAARAIAIDAHDSQSFVALAMAYNSLKNFSKASEASQHALGLYPGSWQGKVELAKSSYGQGQYELALQQLDDVGKDFPDVHLVRGNVLLCLGRRHEALEEFHTFLREDPQDPRTDQIRDLLGR
jgi:tetratricopeptide (TPR) repeat protein